VLYKPSSMSACFDACLVALIRDLNLSGVTLGVRKLYTILRQLLEVGYFYYPSPNCMLQGHSKIVQRCNTTEEPRRVKTAQNS
jgi:hypothetical protein